MVYINIIYLLYIGLIIKYIRVIKVFFVLKNIFKNSLGKGLFIFAAEKTAKWAVRVIRYRGGVGFFGTPFPHLLILSNCLKQLSFIASTIR